MSFLSKLFGSKRLRLPTIIHPIFGSTQAVQDVGDGMFFWEVAEWRHQKCSSLCIHCDAPETGPTDAQVAQFNQVLGNFDHYRALSRDVLLGRLGDYGFENQIDQLQCCGILLSNDGRMTSHWELSFEQPDNGWEYNVNFKDGKADFVTIDS